MHTSNISVAELELIAARGWQGEVTESLGDWLLRAGGGFTGRANSVLAVGESGMDLDDALLSVAQFYRRYELPPRFQLPYALPDMHPMASALVGRGWEIYERVVVMTADCGDISTSLPSRWGEAELAAEPDIRWLQGYQYRGQSLPDNAIAVLMRAEQPVFASLTDGNRLSAVARGVINDGWLGITAVTVQPEFRRLGAGTHLMRELVAWGSRHGAKRVYLQVDGLNQAALALYDRLGFQQHHHYSYARLKESA